MRRKFLENSLLISFLILWFFSWLKKVYPLELVSLLGIIATGYAFKSSLKWRLAIGGSVLAFSLPIVVLTLGKAWYWVTILMALPLYYLGSLLRLSRRPLEALVISALMFAPFVVLSSLDFYTWIIIALYWLIMGFVGSRVHPSQLEALIPPLVTYALSLVMTITPAVTETQLLRVASLVILVPVYPLIAWVAMAFKRKKSHHST